MKRNRRRPEWTGSWKVGWKNAPAPEPPNRAWLPTLGWILLGATVVAGVVMLWSSPGAPPADEYTVAEPVSFEPEESYVDYGAYDED